MRTPGFNVLNKSNHEVKSSASLPSVKLPVFVHLKLYESVPKFLSASTQLLVEVHTVQTEHTQWDRDTQQGNLILQVLVTVDFLRRQWCKFNFKFFIASTVCNTISTSEHLDIVWALICTQFCCAMFCCGYVMSSERFVWSIYPYSYCTLVLNIEKLPEKPHFFNVLLITDCSRMITSKYTCIRWNEERKPFKTYSQKW